MSWIFKLGLKSVKSNLKLIVKTVTFPVIGAVGYFYFDQNVGGVRAVHGPSMRPTLNSYMIDEALKLHRERINIIGMLDDQLAFTRDKSDLVRGDIVLLMRPDRQQSDALIQTGHLVKRVVGLPGDTVTPLAIGEKPREPVVIPHNHVWVESDAGKGYLDSSIFGPVPLVNIIGRGLCAFRLLELNPAIRVFDRQLPPQYTQRVKPAIQIETETQ